MPRNPKSRTLFVLSAVLLAMAMPRPAATQAQNSSRQPIKIGYGIAMTGGIAGFGKTALLAHKIWEEDVNTSGGLLHRQVKLIVYNDQSNPSTVPGIYSKLIDVDKVDLVIGGVGTVPLAAAMPVVMQRQKLFVGLLGLDVNNEFGYGRYFAMMPSGPDPKLAFTKGFFDVAMGQRPKLHTVAIVAADQEFSRNAAEGARENAKKAGLKIVYDKTYPPSTGDFAAIVRAIKATNPDAVVIASYPPDSVGLIRAVNEVGFKPHLIGGAMVGPQSTAIKMQLGALLNGFVNYEFWLPVPSMQFAGVGELMKKYQARASTEGIDPLGYYVAPLAYAQLQVLQQAIEATSSLDDEKLAAYIRAASFETVAGMVKFGAGGEWAESRVLQVQFRGIKGNDLGQFKDISTQVVVHPERYRSGNVTNP
jgi:branched-chain amino acid transport system substrate-binding protein